MEKPFVFACADLTDCRPRSVQTSWELKNDAEVDSVFGDWTTVCNGSKSESVDRCSSLEYGDVLKMHVVFQECFPVLTEYKEANCMVQSLSQLLENTQTCSSQPTNTICDSGSLWSCLVAEPSRLRFSEQVVHSNCHNRVASALRITNARFISEQSVEDLDETPEETSCPPAAALIKTKLLASSSCRRDTPAFLYQISQQWLTQCGMQLQPQHHKNTPPLNYGGQ
ncbi:uncharacterized protein si:dkey-229e3.2 isoform X1 [Esox lucius]|uniref:uncharacterized protein si:dkey-229e3.2 isoform X1 n=1 Tax=Esox lucius TaxID=8010 RepID=UPI001477600E|nr:uncharacterized protein si:dkey-229e3.2 isoform X1 [Esox lucius]